MKRSKNDFFDEENSLKEARQEARREIKPVDEEKPKSGSNKKKKTTLIVICCVLAVLMIAAVLFVVLTERAEAKRQQEVVDQILGIEVFHEGVVIDGVNVTGLTKEQAREYIEAAHAEEGLSQYTVVKNEAYKQAETAADERAAEEAAKQEAAVAEAVKAAEAAATTDDTADGDGEIALDENGLPITETVDEPVDAPQETLLYTEDSAGNFLLNEDCVVVSYNLDEVLDEAFNLAKSGTYEELIAEVNDIKTNGREFTTTKTLDVTGAETALRQISEKESIAAVDAKLEFNTEYDPSKGDDTETSEKFKYIDEVPGITIDAAATYTALETMAQAGEIGDVEMVTTEVAPTTTVETLKNTVVLRGSYDTDFSGKRGYAERVWNITKAAGMINGMVIQPGETFSMNDSIGVRNKENGWKMAGALSGGQSDVKQYGGGVCQVSTTLYNAVVKADLEIVYRQAHSEKSAYVPGGLDATINSVGNQIDFKWKNNTNSPVIIVAYTVGYKLYVDVYGEPFATDEYDEIRLTSKQISTIKPTGEITYQLDKTKPASYSKVLVKRRDGSKWQSYKNYYKNGQLVKTENLATSTYRAYAGVTVVGQLPGTSPSVTPTTPTTTPGTPTTTPGTPTTTPESPDPSDSTTTDPEPETGE